MKNGNMPAAPIWQEVMDIGDDAGGGLTKLEHFAGMAMQAIVNNAGRNQFAFNEPENIAKKSIEIAKALLVQLEAEANE